ncbi:MAG: CBS domain-containing protein [Candidatus Omnitrophica bacterium]|nr:CBS domain-containing protein [Candidatus Omnitrophota bacterium]
MEETLRCPYCDAELMPGTDNCDQCHQDVSDLALPDPAPDMKEYITSALIKDLPPQEPILVEAHTPVVEVVKRMQGRCIGSALVVDGRGALVGIFTDRDVLSRVGVDPSGLDSAEIRFVMTPDPVALRETDSLAAALHKMSVGGFRHLPVLRDGKPVGVVSVREVFHYLCRSEPD